MANQLITITVIDLRWPVLKLVVNRDGMAQVVEAMYDGAFLKFETPVKNALQFAVEQAIKSHKGR